MGNCKEFHTVGAQAAEGRQRRVKRRALNVRQWLDCYGAVHAEEQGFHPLGQESAN